MCDLYERIERQCEKRNIKLAELARQAGLSGSTFSDLKRGKTKSLSLDALISISDIFNISIDELIGRKKEAPSQKRNEAMDKVIDLFGQMTEEQRELALKIVEQVVLSGIK